MGLFLLPAVAFAQLGPYEIQLAADHFPAQLLRREKNGDVWLRRINPDGTPGPQVGYAAADLTGVAMPRPAFFSNIEAMVAALAAPSADAAARAHAALDKFILQSRPFRDLPGVVSDEAVFLKGRVLDRQGKYPEAIRLYEELRAKTNPESSFAETARIREGIDHAKLTNSLDAVECLAGLILPEEDEPLLSELLFALGDSYAQLENWDNALLSYLTLAVFYPYAGNNEARALTRAMTCYAALGEWEPLYRTIQDTIAIDPAGPAADYARRFAKKYAKELGQAGQFVEGGERVVADVAATAVEGTVAATEAPEHTQIQTAPAVSETVAETVEYPDDLL
ncbi:MAG: hypothetical protein IK066_10570 [Kiritimatiellae bacterium]|nr:hypothetical protein [Kiritimatiellia bacterium]